MRLLNKLLASVVAVSAAMLMNACSEKDLYLPETNGSDEVPVEGNIPDFALSANVSLTVNYNIPEYKVNFEVYAENPLIINTETGVRTMKEGVKPIFSAYTDDNCKFEGEMYIPTAVKTVYLYSDYIGISQCVELPVEATGVSYDSSVEEQQAATRGKGNDPAYVGVGKEAYVIDAGHHIYSLTRFTDGGYISSKYAPATEHSKGLIARINALLKGKSTQYKKQNNSKLVRDEGITNICIVANSGDKKVESAAIDLKYVSERAGYLNVLGYYYYKTGTKPNVESLPKYIIFSNVSSEDSWDPLRTREKNKGKTVRLKFFGENYNELAQDKFKPGYTIGWFMISDGYNKSDNTIKVGNQILYSNASWNKDSKSRCIAVYDKSSGKTIVGFEDGIGDGHDSSYEDALFYVESDPFYAIEKPDDRPDIDPDPTPEPEPDVTTTTYGTFAFEDEWPGEGDYDLNDAVIKYSSSVTYNSENEVVKMVASFTPVQPAGAAFYNNAFGFQLLGCSSTDITAANATLEDNQNYPTFIVFNNLSAEKNTKTITLDFAKGVDKKRVDISQYNPFIVTNADKDMMLGNGRNEVHLPKSAPTKLGKEVEKNKWGSYYVSATKEDGIRFPFAINIPGEQGFKLSSEKTRIDFAYDYFKPWVEKGCGTENADWYLYPNDDKVQK